MYLATVQPNDFQIAQNLLNLKNLVLHNYFVPAKHNNNKHISFEKINLDKMY